MDAQAESSECGPLREERDIRDGAPYSALRSLWRRTGPECTLHGSAAAPGRGCLREAGEGARRPVAAGHAKRRVLIAVACLFPLALTSCTSPPILHRDRFATNLSNWVVEQMPGGTVTIEDGVLVIADEGGCTVWFKQRLDAPVVITYTATVSSKARVSDLNCFWMATDPSRSGDLLAPGHSRTGAFATYDNLRTYYVGYGGNANTTTRFRRYAGDGTKPLLPEHDLSAPELMLKPDHPYRIALVVVGSRVQYHRDGELIFDFTDPEPLTGGWFGFRTVQSRIEIRDFQVRRATPADLIEKR